MEGWVRVGTVMCFGKHSNICHASYVFTLLWHCLNTYKQNHNKKKFNSNDQRLKRNKNNHDVTFFYLSWERDGVIEREYISCI